jgi:threonine dehydratase
MLTAWKRIQHRRRLQASDTEVTMQLLQLDTIEAARRRIQQHLVPTPLIRLGGDGYCSGLAVKPEYLQHGGSFKIRGAVNSVLQLTDEQKSRGVIAYSTGNHAQAVGLAAKAAGTSATIIMSPDVPDYKLLATCQLGARVVMAESSSEARRRLAEDIANKEGLTLIPPYDDPAVMAGQGTIGLEILEEDIPAAVYVPVGGGGLIAGIAAAIKQREPSVRILGVEPAKENDAYLSWRADQRIALPRSSNSIADAIKVQILGQMTFPLMRRYVDDIVLVEDHQIIAAMRLYFRKTGHRLEPAGATALAAAISARAASPGTVVCIGSGQNIALERFEQLTGTTSQAELSVDGNVAMQP